MNIVHLIDYFQPVLGYQETFLAREQLRLGHAVTVVTSDRYAPFPDYAGTLQPLLGKRIRSVGQGIEEGIPVWRLPVRGEYAERCWLRGLDHVLATLRPDVVNAHGVIKLTCLQAVLLKPGLGYRLLVDDHMQWENLDVGRGNAFFYGMFRLLLAPLFRRRIDVLVAITDQTATIIRDIYGLNTSPVQVIELGVDTELFCRDKTARQTQRAELGLAPSDFVIIFTGKLIPSKAPHWLLKVLPQCPPQVRVLLVGNAAGDYRQYIDHIITTYRLEGRVILQAAVKQTELPRYYSAADAACWPRGVSIAMLEASACALPIIIPAGKLPERVRYGNGLQYREGDIADLARCITQLAQDLAKARQMGIQGRHLVEERHSWAAINRQFLMAYGFAGG